MYKIYIAGAISNSDPLEFLKNIQKGMRAAAVLLQAGYAVFCPHLDYQLFLQLRGLNEWISIEQIKNHSMEWLRVCDAVLVLPGFACSVGVYEEMAEALKRKIPVFYLPSAMNDYFNKLERKENEKEGT